MIVFTKSTELGAFLCSPETFGGNILSELISPIPLSEIDIADNKCSLRQELVNQGSVKDIF
jgi:hypothetical protein